MTGEDQTDAPVEERLTGLLEKFCHGVARKDLDAVMGLALDPDVVVITSERALLRGVVDLRRFVAAYVEGATTYSWDWDRCEVCTAGSVAWLVAEGTETAETDGVRNQHAYRMTMVADHRDGEWVLRQIHGSSPH